MSEHADRIRRGLSEYDSEIDSVRRQHESLDALLAEIEEWRVLAARQLEEFTINTAKYRAENQQLRERCERYERILYPQTHEQFDILNREALAGDGE